MMKTIIVSDEDYNTLMELSKELQTQTNNYQAFPYFWEPSSQRLSPNLHGEGEIVVFIQDGDRNDPKDVWDEDEDLRKDFLKQECYPMDTKYEDDSETARDWISYVEHYSDDYDVYTEDYKQVQEHNPSLFLSDVQEFVKHNSHHLGKDPHTYSRTIFRMPKMFNLVQCVLRLNKDHGEEVNHEAKRYL